MSEEESWLASAAYLPPNERRVALTNKGYNVDTNDDEFYAASKDNTVYHGHRGTSNSDDFWTDTKLAAGNIKDTARFKRSDLKSRFIIRKYENQRHVHLGHSLGGTLADHISRQYDKNHSIAFNMGTSPLLKQEAFSGQHQHHRVGDDLISSFTSKKATSTQNNGESALHKTLKKSIYMMSPLASIYGGVEALQAHKMNNF